MLSNILDKISFWSLFLIIVLLPVFFLPFLNISVETSKGLLLVAGLAVSIIFWTMARFFDGEIVLPKSALLLSGFGIVIAFFLSAFFSSTSEVSFFGTMFDVGSFWFVFATFLLMFCSSVVLKNSENAKLVFLGVIVSSFVVLFFQSLHLFIPETLSLGVLSGKTDNILGSWNALGILAGFTSVISLFLVEFFFMERAVKWALWTLIGFSVLLVATVNFSLVWILLGVFSFVIFIYKMSLAGRESQKQASFSNFPFFSFLLFMVSLLFFMSGQYIGGFIPNSLGLPNVEARPTLATTSSIAKSVILKDPILGLGPNKFANAWTIHKPVDINTTLFWDVSFNTGSGLLTTMAATTGILGILSLLLFFLLFLISGVKSLFSTLQSGTNQEMTAFFVASFYLFVASLFYSTGPVIFLLAFAFAGAFIGLTSLNQPNREIRISFLSDPRKSFFFMIFLIFVMVTSAVLSFKYIERFASVFYFGKTISSENITDTENYISKALTLYSNDLYYRTYTQVYLAKLNSLLTKTSALSETEKADLQVNFDRAVAGATRAIQYNKDNYINYRALGSVYEMVAPLGVPDAYTKAFEAYKMASDLNPFNPGLKLLLARVSFSDKKVEEAKKYANEALSLKPKYVDTLVMLSQIAMSENNKKDALSYGEQALLLAPTNESLIKYVNSIKSSKTSSSTNDEEEESP